MASMDGGVHLNKPTAMQIYEHLFDQQPYDPQPYGPKPRVGVCALGYAFLGFTGSLATAILTAGRLLGAW